MQNVQDPPTLFVHFADLKQFARKGLTDDFRLWYYCLAAKQNNAVKQMKRGN